jgi:PAS domain S-box-containing protein
MWRPVVGIELKAAAFVATLVVATAMAFAVVAPVDELLRGHYAAGARDLAGALGILGVAVGLALAFTRRLVRPLRREIAEREAAERQLRESRRVLADSEIRYRRLYEGIAAGVLTLSADGRLQSANPALVRMLSHASEDELRARHLAEDVYAGPGTLDAILARVRSLGELANVEIRLRRRDGLSIVGLASLRAVWDESGTTAGFEATLIDVTDLKLAESRRRSTELRFRRLFDSNTVGVLFGNLQRRTLDDANDCLLALLGLRRSELPVTLSALTPDEHAARAAEVAARLARDGRIEPFQTECLHRDGTRVPVLISAALVDAPRGDFIAVAIDRSAEVRASRRLQDAKAFYELLLDSVPTRIAAVDAGERIYYWNRAYREWFGVDDERPGRTVAEAVGVRRHATIAPHIRRALAGDTVSFDARVVRPDGPHDLVITYSPTRDPQGQVTGFLSFVHDVTPRTRGAPGLAAVPDADGGKPLRRTGGD